MIVSTGTKTKTAPKLIPFMQASPKTQKNRLAPAYKFTKDIAWKENVPFSIVLGKFGSRYYHKIDPSLKALFEWWFAHILGPRAESSINWFCKT